jgi:anaerobic selenocysteine-containing dehydrogenase
MWPAANIVNDTTEHAEMVLFWGCDPETTPWGFTGQFRQPVVLLLVRQ